MSTPIAVPTPLTDLVDYQPDSVVSKVVSRNEGGVMTIFAFAEGQGLTEHSTPHEATVILLEGEVRLTIADESHTLTAGQILHLPPGIPHALHGGGEFKLLLTILKKCDDE